MTDMATATKLVELNNRMKEAVSEINKVSMELNKFGKDVKLGGWDWYKSGSTTSISTQGNVVGTIVEISSR